MPNISEMTREELYKLAQERDIPGRTKMDKDELLQALSGGDQPPEDESAPPQDEAPAQDGEDTPSPPDPAPPSDDEPEDEDTPTPVASASQLALIAKASTDGLKAKLEEEGLPEYLISPIQAEIDRRARRQKEVESRLNPMDAVRVIKGGPVWRDGFLSDVPDGTILSPEEGARLKKQGMEVKPIKARLIPDAMGVKRLVEVES